jgi:hypothetical protein
LNHLANAPLVLADESGWRCTEHGLSALSADTYLITYRLAQGDRVSRRSTIWRKQDGRWQILYHQGTLVTA